MFLNIRHSWVVRCYERQNFFRTVSLCWSAEYFLSMNLNSDVILSTRLFGQSLARRCVLNWVIFSTKDFAEEFVLRSLRASPLINPFLTPGGWQDEKWVYRKVSVSLKCVQISRIACLLNLSPLEDSSIQEVYFFIWDFSRKFNCWVVSVC